MYSSDERIGKRELVLLYDQILDRLDKDDDKFHIKWKAISRRRDEIVERDNLYSKKIKLITNWYKPGDRHNE
mgnify:CR=1 FL=1